MLNLKKHLKDLTEAHAPSGHEAPIRAILREAWKDYVDEFVTDKLGSLIGIKRATHPQDPPRKLMIAAHMDEIGMMVSGIVDGFVLVHRISGVDNRILPAQSVMVHGKQPLRGLVATKPPHLLTEADRKNYPSFEELVIDLGLPAETVNELVTIGDLITMDAPIYELNGKRLAGKAMDDRACVAIVTAALELLNGMAHTWDVYAVATVQEETGLFGARTAAQLIRPDIAIALDVCFAEQPGVDADDAVEMGAGPSIGLGANFHEKLRLAIREVAKQYEIKYQDEVIPAASGTDAWATQVANEGIPSALLSLPLRNMHSPVETIDLTDIERTARLLAFFTAGLPADFLATIEWDAMKEGAK
ncbi:MAG: M42 family metallopeptidase [bacterium]|nr:M42 family metallopeptidase [bacterium]